MREIWKFIQIFNTRPTDNAQIHILTLGLSPSLIQTFNKIWQMVEDLKYVI
jgi:hypothetical protein